MRGAVSRSHACHALNDISPNLADLSELDLPSTASINFPDGKDKFMRFEVVLRPDEGMYR